MSPGGSEHAWSDPQVLSEEPEVVRDPEAFLKGRRKALEAVLAGLDLIPESLISRTRDEGRGAAHACSLVRPLVERLLADPTWLPDLDRA